MKLPYFNEKEGYSSVGVSPRRRKILKGKLSVAAFTILINAAGAGVTFCYFAFVEAGLMHGEEPAYLEERSAFFFMVLSFLLVFTISFILKFNRSVRRDLLNLAENPEPTDCSPLVDKMMNLPGKMAAVTFITWMLAGVLYSIGPCLLDRAGLMNYPFATLRAVSALVFIGAPFTTIFVYFFLERTMRRAVQELFPRSCLMTLPGSMRILVLPKILIVSLLIGIIPVSSVSVLILTQIHEIYVGKQNIASFLSNMPLVLGFILFVAVILIIALSVSVTKSVAEPLRLVESGIEEIRSGNLEVTIPVVSNDEIGFLAESFNRMVTGLKERDFIRDVFGRYLSSEIVEELLTSPKGVKLGGELREVTILVSDLRSFTSFTASLKPEVVVKILNRYLERMVDIIMDKGGIIDEFTGDGILAFFGAPRETEGSQERAVRAAIEMQEAIPSLNRELLAMIPEICSIVVDRNHRDSIGSGSGDSNGHTLKMGIGISSGILVVGNIGSEKRRKYGAVGTAINVAFRLEKATRGDDILISPEVYEKTAHVVETEVIPDVELKGIDRPITVYRVIGLREKPAEEINA